MPQPLDISNPANGWPSLRQLHAFRATVMHNSIRRAANAIHLSQPAVSHALRKLEANIGSPLLTRTPQGAYATPEGDILLRRVMRFSQRLANAADGDEKAAWRLSLSQIRALQAIADGRSFAAAARRLGIAEPSLHRAAREIELVLGRTLYHRTPEGMAVTKSGARTARELNLAMREIDNALEEIARHRGDTQSRLRIGSLPLVHTRLLPRAVNAITERFPGTSVAISDGAYDPLLFDLRQGKIDFLIGALRNPAPAPDVVEEMLFVDRFAVVARAGHPLMGQRHVSPRDLARYDWITAHEKTPIRARFDAIYAELGINPRAIVETSSLVAIRAMLAESDKLTLLSQRQIIFEQAAGLLDIVPVTIPDAERPIGLTVRKDWLPTPLQTEFIELVRHLAAEQS